jgi:hypothetical protein
MGQGCYGRKREGGPFKDCLITCFTQVWDFCRYDVNGGLLGINLRAPEWKGRQVGASKRTHDKLRVDYAFVPAKYHHMLLSEAGRSLVQVQRFVEQGEVSSESGTQSGSSLDPNVPAEIGDDFHEDIGFLPAENDDFFFDLRLHVHIVRSYHFVLREVR